MGKKKTLCILGCYGKMTSSPLTLFMSIICMTYMIERYFYGENKNELGRDSEKRIFEIEGQHLER